MTRLAISQRPHKMLYLLMAAIIGLAFSYHPLLQLGTVAGIHVDISLSYLFVGIAILSAIPVIWKQRSHLLASKGWLLLASLIVYSAISATWSPNPIRGTLTAIFWLAILALVSAVMLYTKQLLEKKRSFSHWAFTVYAIVIIWAVWQLIADALGISAFYSLLPAMYSGEVFGFARPTGFALEPQFLGSLLLVPFAWLTYRIANKKIVATPYELAAYTIVTSLLVLTLSRGALLGAVIITVALFISMRPMFRSMLRYGSLVLIAILGALTVIYALAQIRTSDTTSGMQSVGRAVNHLSLGIIADDAKKSSPSTSTATKQANTTTTGYVHSSTDSRISQAEQAVRLWQTNTATVVFGVGLGGFGAASESKQPGAIVNNYYLEVLAEGGLVALGLFAGLVAILLSALVRKKQWLLCALLAGLLAQALFYSGNANILHAWVLVGLGLGIILPKNVNAKQY